MPNSMDNGEGAPSGGGAEPRIPYPRTRLARRAVLATLAVAGAASLLGPRLHVRHELAFLDVVVTATKRVNAGGVVTLLVRGRNTHPSRKRVYPTWVDVSESLGRAGAVMTMNQREGARWVPIARSWRVPFPDEIPPGESRDLSLRIVGAKPGRYEGTVDVVLEGTSWVRSEVSFEVAEALPARP